MEVKTEGSEKASVVVEKSLFGMHMFW